jgi:hypothetical protein
MALVKEPNSSYRYEYTIQHPEGPAQGQWGGHGVLLLTDLENGEQTAAYIPLHLLEAVRDVLAIAEHAFNEDPAALLITAAKPLVVSGDLYFGQLMGENGKKFLPPGDADGFFNGPDKKEKWSPTLSHLIAQIDDESGARDMMATFQFDDMINAVNTMLSDCPHPYRLNGEARSNFLDFHFHTIIELLLVHQLYQRGDTFLEIIGNLTGVTREITDVDRAIIARFQNLTPIQRAYLEQQLIQGGDYVHPDLTGVRTQVLANLAARAQDGTLEQRRELAQDILANTPLDNYYDGEVLKDEERQVLAMMVHREEMLDLRARLGQLRDHTNLEHNPNFLRAVNRILLRDP